MAKQYVCDKCKRIIKESKLIKCYCKDSSGTFILDGYDLCESCKDKLIKWLQSTPRREYCCPVENHNDILLYERNDYGDKIDYRYVLQDVLNMLDKEIEKSKNDIIYHDGLNFAIEAIGKAVDDYL